QGGRRLGGVCKAWARPPCPLIVGGARGIALVCYRFANRFDHLLRHEHSYTPDVLSGQAVFPVEKGSSIRSRMGEVASRYRFDRNLVDLPTAAEVFGGQPEVCLLEVLSEMAGI